MQTSLISLVTVTWLFTCLTDRTDAQRSYYVYEYGKPYYPSDSVGHPSQDQIVSIIPKPPSYIVENNYRSESYQNHQSPLRFPDEDFSSESGGQYYHHPNTGRTDDRRVFNDEKTTYQQLEAQEEEKGYVDAEIFEKMQILDKILSENENESDLDTNTIEGQIMAEANIPEEAKRVVRQVRKQKPGFFWTLAKVTFQSINDTTSAIKQISQIITKNILPDSVTSRSSLKVSTVSTPPTMTDSSNGTTSSTTMRPTTTTKEPFVLTRGLLQSLLRKNILGLVKLFNIEWRDALNQSDQNTREFQKELGNQIGSYLQDNPKAY